MQLHCPPLAAQWVAAGAGVVIVQKVADIVVANLKLCGVVAYLVCCPIGESLAVCGP